MTLEKLRPVKVLSLFCGTGMDWRGIAARYPGRTIHYLGVDQNIEESSRRVSLPEQNVQVIQTFQQAKIEIDDLEKFEAQLEELLGGQQFDEVHVHMPRRTIRIPTQGKKLRS